MGAMLFLLDCCKYQNNENNGSSSEMMAMTVTVNFPSELLDLLFLDMEISLALHLGWSTVIKIIFCLTNEKISSAVG